MILAVHLAISKRKSPDLMVKPPSANMLKANFLAKEASPNVSKSPILTTIEAQLPKLSKNPPSLKLELVKRLVLLV